MEAVRRLLGWLDCHCEEVLRSNLMTLVIVKRLLRCARNDNKATHNEKRLSLRARLTGRAGWHDEAIL